MLIKKCVGHDLQKQTEKFTIALKLYFFFHVVLSHMYAWIMKNSQVR